MKRTLLLILAAALLACGRPDAPTSAPPAQPAAVARCGGTGGFQVGGLTAVTAGMDDQFLTATARQAVKVKPGVEVKPQLDAKGVPVAVTLRMAQQSADYTCRCPDGCGGSCSLVLDSTDPDFIECVGDCSDGDVCCFGCGLFKN